MTNLPSQNKRTRVHFDNEVEICYFNDSDPPDAISRPSFPFSGRNTVIDILDDVGDTESEPTTTRRTCRQSSIIYWLVLASLILLSGGVAYYCWTYFSSNRSNDYVSGFGNESSLV